MDTQILSRKLFDINKLKIFTIGQIKEVNDSFVKVKWENRIDDYKIDTAYTINHGKFIK